MLHTNEAILNNILFNEVCFNYDGKGLGKMFEILKGVVNILKLMVMSSHIFDTNDEPGKDIVIPVKFKNISNSELILTFDLTTDPSDSGLVLKTTSCKIKPNEEYSTKLIISTPYNFPYNKVNYKIEALYE